MSGFAFKRTGDSSKDGSKDTSSKDSSCKDGGKDGGVAGTKTGTGRQTSSSGVSLPGMGHSGEGVRSGGGGGAGEATVGKAGRRGRGRGNHIPEQLLVTTNDSRLRLYNTDDFGMNAKYKGFSNDTLQITASFSEDGKQIISGSENGKVRGGW